MISLSVPAFTAMTMVVWVIAGLVILFGLVAAWQGHFALSLGLCAVGTAVFHVPIVGMFTGGIKLAFDRQDQLLESPLGKAVSAISLVFAMTVVGPFLAIFGFSAIACLILYSISKALN